MVFFPGLTLLGCCDAQIQSFFEINNLLRKAPKTYENEVFKSPKPVFLFKKGQVKQGFLHVFFLVPSELPG